MIVVLSAIAVAGGLLVGRLVAARHKPDKPLSPAGEPTPEETALEQELNGSRGDMAETTDWSAFPCALGDVVMRSIDHAEAWLGGAIVFSEDAPAAALFVAPDAAGERAIYARPLPDAEISWLTPVRSDAFAVGAEPPSAIELEGVRFDRNRRLPLRARRVGTGAPDVGGTAIVGEYGSASGDVAVVVVAQGIALAWRGRRLGEGEYDVWSGEKARR